MYVHRAPRPPLDGFVASLWASEREALPHIRERILPSGCDSVVLALHEAPLQRFAEAHGARGQSLGHALWQGAQHAPVFRDTSAPARVVGITFRPGGAAAFAGVPMDELAGRSTPLDALWGRASTELRERLLNTSGAAARLDVLEAWLRRRLVAAARPDPAVAQALALFAAQPMQANVESVRRRIGDSPQAFVARFRRAVGLTPKRYARVLRFHTLVQRLGAGAAPPLALLALDAGYADQSHLANEFRQLSGLTPTRYRPVASDRPTHVAVERPGGERP